MADGRVRTLIPATPGGLYGLTWSPDSTRLAFTPLDEGFGTVTLSGKITPFSAPGLSSNDIPPLPPEPPQWSPDGKHLVFAANTTGIYIIDANGRGLHPLVSP